MPNEPLEQPAQRVPTVDEIGEEDKNLDRKIHFSVSCFRWSNARGGLVLVFSQMLTNKYND